MKKPDIAKVIKSIEFDEVEDAYSENEIFDALQYENEIPNAKEVLPKDYLWYLGNLGDTTVRNVEYEVQIDSNTCLVLSFSGLTYPQEACNQYRYYTCTGSYDYRLDEPTLNFVLDKKFLPISFENQGEILLMDIKENIGSIWQLASKDSCNEHQLEYGPIFVANSLTEFLNILQPIDSFKESLLAKGFKEIDEFSRVWKKNVLTNEELFYQCLSDYEMNTKMDFTQFTNPEEFLKVLIENPGSIKINEPRAVELFHLSFVWKAKNRGEFLDNIEKVRKLKSNLLKKRKNYKLKKLKQYTNTGYSSIGTNHNFYRLFLESSMNDLQCKETFVFYKDSDTQLLSLVKRVKIEIEDLIIKGIGTFEYDFSWSSKNPINTNWSKIPATIYLTRYQEDFTENYYAFIRQTISDSSFKETLEQFIFDHYQKHDYLEFLAMGKADKDYFEDSYPKVSLPSNIWKVLGEEFDIHFIDDQCFDLQFEYLPDDEHGLAITVTNGKLKIN